jgi:hypothetical protein
LADIIGKIVKVNGGLYAPVSSDYPKDHIALQTNALPYLGANAAWLWIDDKSYHTAIYMLVQIHLSSRDIPVCQDTSLIGRLAFVPNNQVAPIKVDKVSKLMIEDLRYIRFSFPLK